MGQLVNCLGEGAKYINFRAKCIFLMLIYILGNFFSKAEGAMILGNFFSKAEGAMAPSAPR